MHNQLTFENTSIRNSKITYTIFHQYQNGWYDTDISLFDPSLKESELMSRIKLNFNWVGVIYNQSFTFNRFTTNFGANYNMQRRNHVGLENYQDSGFAEIYSNTGVKQEFTQYIKAEYKILGLSLYGDIQSRYVNYRYRSQPINLTLYNNQHFNYSGGASFKLSNVVIHYGIGKTTREPRRSDILGGLDNYQGSLNILKDESVYSQDAGIKFTGNKLEASVNMYDMQFKNEFMPTGLYGENSIGLYKNVDESYRRGVEISGKYKSDKLEVSGNLTLSKNRYQSKDNNIPGPTVFMKWNKSILSPDAVGNINVMYKFDKFWFVGVNTRYNSKTFIDLDNTYNLPAFCVLDGYIGATRKMVEFRLNINNLTNSLILTNGMIGFDGSPRYFVMSKINTLFTLKIKI
jgi:iron complex outermembrane receptor protein